jgi:HNH endonuclease
MKMNGHKRKQTRLRKTFNCSRCHAPTLTKANWLIYCKECQRQRHNERNRQRSLIHKGETRRINCVRCSKECYSHPFASNQKYCKECVHETYRKRKTNYKKKVNKIFLVNCEKCGTQCSTHSPRTKFCRLCKKQVQNERKSCKRAEKPKPAIVLTCKECSQSFIANINTPYQKYCSMKCRLIARKRYERDYNIMHSDKRNEHMVQLRAKQRSIRGAPTLICKICDKRYKRTSSFQKYCKDCLVYMEKHWAIRSHTLERIKIRSLSLSRLPPDRVVHKRMNLFGEGVCCFCNALSQPLTLEHLIPITRGGTNDEENLFGSCARCNYSKKTKAWVIWFRKQPFYSYEREKSIKLFNSLQTVPIPNFQI